MLHETACLVRGAGIEPAHPFGYEILSLGRLPISPPALHPGNDTRRAVGAQAACEAAGLPAGAAVSGIAFSI